MRFREEFDLYCRERGRVVHVRTWDRLIARLGLATIADEFERRRLTRGAALIGRAKPKARVSVDVIEARTALEVLQRAVSDEDGLSGQQVYDLICRFRQVSFRQVQRWGEPHGLRLAAKRQYRGEALRKWLDVIIRNIPGVRL